MYDGLGFVTDFMNWIVSSSWKGVVVMLITNPLTMTIIAGLVFEGRMVKLWHGQSRSFFPGDLFLAIAAIVVVVANNRITASDLPDTFVTFWCANGAIIAFFIALIVLWLMRKVYDAPAYSRTLGATANSATKWAHDFFGYWWYTLVLITMGMPLVVAAFTASDKTYAVMAIVFGLSIAAWGSMDALWDRKYVDYTPATTHPDDSHCWYRKLLIKWQNASYDSRSK